MTDLPASLGRADEEEFLLPSGRSLGLRRLRPAFCPWGGSLPEGARLKGPGIELVEVDGKPAFAEQAVLAILRADGWEGAWRDPVSRAYRSGSPESPPLAQLPEPAAGALAAVDKAGRSSKGAWSLVCWRGQEIFLAEVLRSGREQIRSHQLSWMETALMAGWMPDAFLLIDWTCEKA
jgi:hypothetical protein